MKQKMKLLSGYMKQTWEFDGKKHDVFIDRSKVTVKMTENIDNLMEYESIYCISNGCFDHNYTIRTYTNNKKYDDTMEVEPREYEHFGLDSRVLDNLGFAIVANARYDNINIIDIQATINIDCVDIVAIGLGWPYENDIYTTQYDTKPFVCRRYRVSIESIVDVDVNVDVKRTSKTITITPKLKYLDPGKLNFTAFYDDILGEIDDSIEEYNNDIENIIVEMEDIQQEMSELQEFVDSYPVGDDEDVSYEEWEKYDTYCDLKKRYNELKTCNTTPLTKYNGQLAGLYYEYNYKF